MLYMRLTGKSHDGMFTAGWPCNARDVGPASGISYPGIVFNPGENCRVVTTYGLPKGDKHLSASYLSAVIGATTGSIPRPWCSAERSRL